MHAAREQLIPQNVNVIKEQKSQPPETNFKYIFKTVLIRKQIQFYTMQRKNIQVSWVRVPLPLHLRTNNYCKTRGLKVKPALKWG
jgi:hypothetical protein